MLYKFFLLGLITLSGTLLYQKHTYAYETFKRTDPIPKTKQLIKEEKYSQAQEYLGYFMQFDYVRQMPEAHALLSHIKAKRESLGYTSEKIIEGVSTGHSDELAGQLSAIGSDFFILGDLRDLGIEGQHYYKNEEVDSVLVALSTIGVVASLSNLFTFGGASVVKSGISLLKLGHKSGHIPPWMIRYLIKESKTIQKTKDLSPIKPLFHNIETLRQEVGLSNALRVIAKSRNREELAKLAKLSQHYKQETKMLLDLSNNRVLTHAHTFKSCDKESVKIASTYGEHGFIQLQKGGEKHFIKTTQRLKSYAKVGYKGEAWKIFLSLMQYLSDTMLMTIMGIASLLLIPLKRWLLILPRSMRF